MAVTSLMISAGSAFSPSFALRGDRPIGIIVASHTGVGWGIAFAANSGGPFSTYFTDAGAGSPFVVASVGTDFSAIVRFPVTGYARLTLSAAATSSVAAVVTDINRF